MKPLYIVNENDRKKTIQDRLNLIKSRYNNNVDLTRKEIKTLFDIIEFDDYLFKIKGNYQELCENEINRLNKELRFNKVKSYPECLTFCVNSKECQKGNIPMCD